jgi:cell division protein FtsL
VSRAPEPSAGPSKLIAALLGVAIVVAGFATLMIRLEVTQEGYRLSTLQVEVRQLEERNQRLKLQSAELSSRERLRSLASKYGLEPPVPGRVVMMP